MKTTNSKKILITFGRSFLSLELARLLHAAGHRIFIADSMIYHVCRFSNAVEKNFIVPSPRFHPNDYINSLADIIKKEKIDLLIPIFEEITLLAFAKNRFPSFCEVFSPSFELYHELHSKWLFQCKLEELGISHPKTFLIQHPKDLEKLDFKKPYALKPCYSRASQDVKKVHPESALPSITIEKYNPWVAQEWIEGKRFCTYTVCKEGSVTAHAVYPVSYAIGGNSCIIFEAIEHPSILLWIKHFVEKIKFTGQIAFDFIEAEDGVLYAIECNPRATSGVLLFSNEDRLDHAFLADTPLPISPRPGTRKQIATGMLLYGWRKAALPNNRWRTFLKDLFNTKDVILRPSDIKPFLFEPLIFANIWLNSQKYGMPIPASFTYDHDWNGEAIKLDAAH